MTLLVASDLHLGAGASLGERLADQRSSWTRVCTTAAELRADVIFAGDAFHQRRPLPAEMRAWQAGLDILAEAGRTLIAIPGNHDVSSLALPTGLEAACAGYDAHVLRSWRVEDLVVETIDGPVGFLPWTPSTTSAPQMAANLMVIAQGIADAGARVLIAHWALSGASLPTGLPVLELAEPILDSFALAQMGFDVVLAGHIHKRQVIVGAELSSHPTGEGESHVNGALDTDAARGSASTGRAPAQALVAHIGPLSRSGFGEAGVETGAWQISPAALPTSLAPLLRPLEASWFEVPDRRFVSLKWDLRGSSDATGYAIALMLEDEDVDQAIVRAEFQVTADQVVDVDAIADALAEGGAHHIDRVTPIVERVVSTRSVGLTEQDDPTVAFDHWLGAQADLASPETMSVVRERAHERIGGAS